ncbi:DUF4158 domain-containing protein [Streptomyces sp. NPDC048415]|uniref:DUF4158 domain-containing protein n=1 Tax=Streptomyces sp. NPDC048415 TaxID=3154822 RepID=UPI00342A6C95
MGRDLGLNGVVEHFTLDPGELALLRNKTGATRLGFTAMLKFLLFKGRFPRGRFELPDDAVDHLARQAKAPAGDIGFYDFTCRTALVVVDWPRPTIRMAWVVWDSDRMSLLYADRESLRDG